MLAYLTKHSFKKDEIIDLFISGKEGEATITILNILDNEKNNIDYESKCSIFEQNTQKFSFAEGCNWNISHQINLSNIDINPGLYAICIKHQQLFEEYYLPFIIINIDNKNDILVIVNTNTWCTYNNWGGASFYRINKTDENYIDNINNINITNSAYDSNCSSGTCSFNRPSHSDFISNSTKQIIYNKNKPVNELGEHLLLGEKYLWFWLLENNYKFDLITDIDVENIKLLENRKIIMLNCHAEYWSHKMYYNLLNIFSNTNTNLINLSGNSIWRKVVINYEKNRIEKIGNPFCNDVLNWYDSNFSIDDFAKNNKITIPPYLILGVFYDIRGYGTYSDIECINDNSWIFNDTGIKKGDIIGKIYDVAKPSGHETDKMYHIYIKEDEKNYFNNSIILGKGTNLDNGGGEIVIHNFKNSKVFSCGSISFTRCINDPQVTIMLKNVIENFLL